VTDPRDYSTFSLLFLALVTCGCGGRIEMTRAQFRHQITVNTEGEPVEIRVTSDQGSRIEANFEDQIDLIGEEIRKRFSKNDTIQILLFFHGGLVNTESAVASANASLEEMGKTHFYPIFVNWNTGLLSSYGDHLFQVRDGRRAPIEAAISSPLFFIADFGTALLRLPVTFWNQGFQVAREFAGPDEIRAPGHGWERTAELDDPNAEWTIQEHAFAVFEQVVPGIVRLGSTFLLDGIGRSAYSNIERRARVLFVKDEDYQRGRPRTNAVLPRLMNKLRWLRGQQKAGKLPHDRVAGLHAEIDATRALLATAHENHEDGKECPECRSLLQKLRDLNRTLRRGRALKITVVAHSMGTIVANELIRRNGDFYYDNIAYMGAACTIRDFANTALVQVREDPNTSFYNLCLHPFEEANDRYGWRLLPFGSLLVWIDNYLTDKKDAMDRTLGQWNNVIAALPVIDYLPRDVRSRIHIKGFGRSDKVPRDHGEFNDAQDKWGEPRFRYWDPEFWISSKR